MDFNEESYELDNSFEEESFEGAVDLSQLDLEEEEDFDVDALDKLQVNKVPENIQIDDSMPDDVKERLKTINEIFNYSRENDGKNLEALKDAFNASSNTSEFDDGFGDEDYSDEESAEENSNNGSLLNSNQSTFNENELDDFF